MITPTGRDRLIAVVRRLVAELPPFFSLVPVAAGQNLTFTRGKGKYYRELLWLGQLPVRDWARWLTPAYFELLTLPSGDDKDGGGGGMQGEEAEEDASP